MSCWVWFGSFLHALAFLALSGEGKDREGGKGWDRFNKRSRQFDMKETGKKKVGAHDEGASCLGKMGGISWKIYQGLRKGREGEKRDAEIQFLVSWETGLLNFLLSGAHGEDLTMVCVWLRVLTSNAKDKGIERDQSCSTIHKMSVWVDKEITSWSKMGGNSIAAPPSARKWGCGGISEELFMFWTRKLEWILAGIWIPCQLDRVNPKLGFKCVLDSW